MTVKYVTSSHWQQMPAPISSLNLKRGSNNASGVHAKYAYFFQGSENHSDVVALNNVNDNLGYYWQDIYKKLERDQANTRVCAWVNPDSRNDALLYKAFHWAKAAFGSVFVLIFDGFGAFFISAPVKGAKPEEEIRNEN